MLIRTEELPSPFLDEARARLSELKGVFSFNEVITMLSGLIAEVDSMPLASRFSHERELYSASSVPDDLNPMLVGMTEEQHKRWQLNHNLSQIRDTVLQIGNDFETVFLDMQAAQHD